MLKLLLQDRMLVKWKIKYIAFKNVRETTRKNQKKKVHVAKEQI